MPDDYEQVEPGSTDHHLMMYPGDSLEALACVVKDPNASGVYIRDGGSPISIMVLPPKTAIGTHHVKLGLRSRYGGWKITTEQAVSVIATLSRNAPAALPVQPDVGGN